MAARHVVVLISCPSRAAGAKIAHALVRRRLAACVNLLPGLTSIFVWRGKLERCREVLLIAKTTAARFPALRRAVRTLHPYTVPEILALRVQAGDPPYLRWVTGAVRG